MSFSEWLGSTELAAALLGAGISCCINAHWQFQLQAALTDSLYLPLSTHTHKPSHTHTQTSSHAQECKSATYLPPLQTRRLTLLL